MSLPEDHYNQANGNFALTTNEHNHGSDDWAATHSRGEGYSSSLLPPTGRGRVDEAPIPFDGTHTEGGGRRSANPQHPYCEVNGNTSHHMKIRRGNNFTTHAYPSDRFRRSRYRPTRGGRSNGKFFFANKTLYAAPPPWREETPHEGDEGAVQRDASSLINHSEEGNLRKGQKRKWTQVPPGWDPTEEEDSTSHSDCVKEGHHHEEQKQRQRQQRQQQEEEEEEEEAEEEPLSQFTHPQNPRSKSYNEITCSILKDAAAYFKNCRGAKTAANSDEDELEEHEEADGVVNHSQGALGENPPSGNLCCVCHTNEYKYKCPFCEARSCSLICSKEHKKLKKCKNKLKKNLKVKRVAKHNFDQNMLHRDYIFLHGVESILHGNYRFLKIKENETTNIWLYSYNKLTSMLKKRKIFLLKAPLYTKLHQGNKTTIRHDNICWMVKVTLVNDGLFVTHQDVSEDTSLLQLLNLTLAKMQKRKKNLRVNYLDYVNAIRVSLNSVELNTGTKKEDACFCVLLKVSEVLRGQAFYEYPHLSFEIVFQDGVPLENPSYEAEGQANEDMNDAAEEGQANDDMNDPADEEDNPICDEQTKGQTHAEEQTTPPPQH
ncbi:hypothetical protein AK88_05002 [Plasmodium fragile]|uniref:HIT-type domain-containing protein n=1 Tax=Plasmodium fragile TaxID=5857 RepID=A0A0D9QE87_PLAFR|nr:uncharacterized protein AK88_05002 [Plasmodium fragile]KJP85375.1 hypothetical protein AK88_05002 [Plasmodium fragile]